MSPRTVRYHLLPEHNDNHVGDTPSTACETGHHITETPSNPAFLRWKQKTALTYLCQRHLRYAAANLNRVTFQDIHPRLLTYTPWKPPEPSHPAPDQPTL